MTLLADAASRQRRDAAPLQKERDQKTAPGRAPSVEPMPEPSAEKKPPPVLREALARTLRSSAGMPSVRPRRLESTPKRPDRPCSAAIWRWNAVLVKAI